jgi:hypothetical protein
MSSTGMLSFASATVPTTMCTPQHQDSRGMTRKSIQAPQLTSEAHREQALRSADVLHQSSYQTTGIYISSKNGFTVKFERPTIHERRTANGVIAFPHVPKPRI